MCITLQYPGLHLNDENVTLQAYFLVPFLFATLLELWGPPCCWIGYDYLAMIQLVTLGQIG